MDFAPLCLSTSISQCTVRPYQGQDHMSEVCTGDRRRAPGSQCYSVKYLPSIVSTSRLSCRCCFLCYSGPARAFTVHVPAIALVLSVGCSASNLCRTLCSVLACVFGHLLVRPHAWRPFPSDPRVSRDYLGFALPCDPCLFLMSLLRLGTIPVLWS